MPMASPCPGRSTPGQPSPAVLERSEGELGTLYGHFARQPTGTSWMDGECWSSRAHMPMSPRWYATRPVPTWNYVAVHASGVVDGSTTTPPNVTRCTGGPVRTRPAR
ncbi:hypothetical protein DSL92_07115 [Billgrantia gudaonensis]|uniref:Uncharacterized protein n=1 Tax=Billgrantia gudaonensis TaxID=376427 RepID=A0A3S0QFN9_9GAMM|nr:hypothetical protein DSL92_07115 [Halomonas gudaonensis]